MSLLSRLSEFLGLTENEVRAIVDKAPLNYKRYQIPKKGGGYRTIFHPAKETKAVQYAVMETLLCQLPVHDAAMAYRPGLSSPTKSNAAIHAPFPFSVKLDFKEFFPSIGPEDLFVAIEQHFGKDKLSTQSRDLLKKVLFVSMHGRLSLAIGAPSSPMVSNAVMFEMDKEIGLSASSIDQNSAYTRYADDIWYSCSKRGGCNNFYLAIQQTIARASNPHLTLNSSKTKFCSRKGRRVVTGLFISPNGGIAIGRDKKRYVKSQIHRVASMAVTDPKELRKLRGYLSFIADVEPAFYGRLVVKYGSEVFNSIRTAR